MLSIVSLGVAVAAAAAAAAVWLLQSKWASKPTVMDLPFVKFDGDNSAARYRAESASILAQGYAQNPLVILPVKYLDEVKWLSEKRMSFWQHIDKQSILTQIGGPGITDEVALAAKQGLNRSLALSAPGKIKIKYPTWLYWASQYLNDGAKTMWKLRFRAGELLSPVLQARVTATKELLAQGVRIKGRRKYEDGVQWLYHAHTARGKSLTPGQLSQDLFVIMTASIHSTSGAGLVMLFDLLARPEMIPEILEEITRTFKDGLTIPAGTTLASPSYHHGFDPLVNPQPDKFDTRRHLRKREGIKNTHKFHFASVAEDMLSWGAG
ncbi:hypothetical protein S40288_06963 [Stachybotrys chartarum IBT 40288]|nr:hypothetical protein S40288_06963 [Stachybotrys chartarum IBT 40288]